MAYAEQASIEPGLLFRTRSGLLVKTTGHTLQVHSVDKYVHEVVILEGPGEGHEFLHNLDAAEPLEAS